MSDQSRIACHYVSDGYVVRSVIMFMRPDFTSAILFLCELFFWLKDNVWLQRMCALLKLLAEKVPAIMPG